MTTDRQASYTAQMISRGMVLVSKDQRLKHLVPKEMADLSLHFISGFDKKKYFIKAVNYGVYRSLMKLKEKVFAPGLLLHLALRKKHIEMELRERLKGPVDTVLVLGAGLDTLALRIHKEFPQTQFVEIDHSGTSKLKHKKIQSLNVGKNYELWQIDLSAQSLSKHLKNRSDIKTQELVIISEGLFMYLSQKNMEDLLSDLVSLGSQKLTLIFTYFDFKTMIDSWSPIRRVFLKRLVSGRGEKWSWSVNVKELSHLFEKFGFEMKKVAGPTELRDYYLGPKYRDQPVAEGEKTCVAERSIKHIQERGNG